MPLPVLPHHPAPDAADLLRLFYHAERQWCAHLGEESTLDFGSAIHNAAAGRVWDANSLFDVALPAGWSPQRLLSEAEAHYAAHGARCASIVPNPSAAPESTRALLDHLAAQDYRQLTIDVLHAAHPAPAARRPAAIEGLKIIPARASYRHLRALIEEWSAPLNVPGFAEVTMLHYDDPRVDALLALKDGAAVGHIGVFSLGEVGRIEDVYVTASLRGQGVGTLLMDRALEICQRALLRHVLLGVDPDNGPAQRLYARFGFSRIGQFIACRAPWTGFTA